MSEKIVGSIERVIRSEWITQGPEVEFFEKEFAAFVGAPHACAVSNCTTALHLALRAAGAKEGTEVITVSHSFIATANSIRYGGATPVFVDIDPDSLNILPAAVEQAITSKTVAILCVHQLGMPCDLLALRKIADKNSLYLIEDAACAIGSQILVGDSWERIGKPHGHVACFSFHPRKLLTTGDGGMLTTNDSEWDKKFRLWRQHGMSVSDKARHQASVPIFETYDELGYNYRLTDIQAAMGRVQLEILPSTIEHRRSQVTFYQTLFASQKDFLPLKDFSWTKSNWQSFGVRIPRDLDQRSLMQTLLDAGISTRRGVMCSHREPAYANGAWSCGDTTDDHSKGCKRLRESEMAQDKMLLLPLFPQLATRDQERIVETLLPFQKRKTA